MSRWIALFACGILGLVMLFCGLMMPVHLRALDSSIVEQAGRDSTSLTDQGLKFVQEKKLGPAQMLFLGAQSAEFLDRTQLGQAVDDLAIQKPPLQIWGSLETGKIGAFFQSNSTVAQWSPGQPALESEPLMEFFIRPTNREKGLELLGASASPLVQELLRTRNLTNTVIFPASQSASGQAFDAVICLSGFLAESGHLTPSLSNAVLTLAADANSHGNVQPFEQFMVELTSLGQRFNWGQLATFVENIKEPATLEFLGDLVRNNGNLPVLYSAVVLSKNGDDVAKFLMKFGETGMSDLRTTLRYGGGGINALAKRDLRLHQSEFRERLASSPITKQFFDFALDYSSREPQTALIIKWALILLSGFLLAAAVHYGRPAVSALERPLQVRGVHWAQEALFALGFLVVVLLLSEPFLSQESQKMAFPFRLRLPMVGSAVPAGNPSVPTTNMNSSILTMLLFFVLQALLYVASLVKLAEIRRQRVAARTKLKLLENEDHLFDAGLYLGFLGTIISLILVSLGVFKQPSLMAAYSSTSFGILFVVLFKVVHLRPARRHLLMEAEVEPARVRTPAETTLAAPL